MSICRLRLSVRFAPGEREALRCYDAALPLSVS
jgi:hypothetical protein